MKMRIGWGGYQDCMFGIHYERDMIATWGQSFEGDKDEEWLKKRDEIYANAMKEIEKAMVKAGVFSIDLLDDDIEARYKEKALSDVLENVKKQLGET